MLAWRIAVRYLFSKKSHGAVNIISMVAVAGVAVATAAIVIVLSVFNGFTQLAQHRLSAIDPTIKILPAHGKTISQADSLALTLSVMPEIASAQPIIEERGLLICNNQQKPVIFKGVGQNYDQIVTLDSLVIDGEYLYEYSGMPATLLSAGVAIVSGARPQSSSIVSLYVPRRTGRINPANPATAFRGKDLITTGVFQLEQAEYDTDYLYLPIEEARDLLEYINEASAIEISLPAKQDADKAATLLKTALGGEYKVLTRAKQEEQSFKMIMVEKWITFLMLAFILVIASFNIISTLSLLVIEKRDNMATMIALGAPMSIIRGIFMRLGMLISIAGGVLGIILGAILALAQQYGGFIKLAGDPAQLSIAVYPVKVLPLDLLIVLALVALVALCTSAVSRILSRAS